MSASRPQQYRLSWPLDPSQVEGLDSMLETLFKRLRALDLAPLTQLGAQGAQGVPGVNGVDGDDSAFTWGVPQPNTITTGFTQGSVIFAGLSNRLTQNNAHFAWDDTHNSLNLAGRGWFTGDGTYSSLILRSGSLAESNGQSPLVITRGADGTVCTTFIDALGGINSVIALRLLGNLANCGSVDANGVFTAASTAGTGVSCMLDIYSDTTAGWTVRTSSAGGAYVAQCLDASGNFVFSIEADGSLKWGAGASHAAEDTTLARTAAGKLSLVGTTPMFQLGGTSASFPALKRNSATLQIRLADDSGYADLDVATIHPAASVDFRLKQNSVDVIYSKESTAVATVAIEAGKFGIGTGGGTPVAKFQVIDGSGNFIASNNSFGNDWIILTNDTGLSSSKYFLGESSTQGTVLNARGGLYTSFRIGNAEQARLTTTGLGIGITATAVLHLKAGTTAANTAPLKFTSGTNLTSAEAGAMEWDGTNLFISQTTGPTRKTLSYTTDFPYIAASTFEKAETGTDANVLTYTTNASTDEALHVGVMTDVSALTGTSVVVTVTWKDSNNVTATATTTLSGVSDGTINVPINAFKNTNVVVSTVFTGVSTTYNISAIITRNK